MVPRMCHLTTGACKPSHTSGPRPIQIPHLFAQVQLSGEFLRKTGELVETVWGWGSMNTPEPTAETWEGFREDHEQGHADPVCSLGGKLQRNSSYEGGGESRPRQCMGLWGEAGGGVLAALGLGGQPR